MRETAKTNYKDRGGRFVLSARAAYAAAFLVPVFIMLIIFFAKEIFPFGDETFLRTDMYHQYAPFFSEFQHKLKNGGNLLYSWDIGMGVNFAALYAYYLASPLNWLIVLVPKGYILEFMTYMIVVKIGLSGLFMAWYLRRGLKLSDMGASVFGIFYALSGYMAAYSWNIMWLDCILLFPVIVYGLERLVREKQGLLYGLSLGVCILSNYYISIMICIFMVIYFIALNVLTKPVSAKDFFMRCLRFALFSLLAGGFAAVTLLPEIAALQATASASINFPQTASRYFSIVDMFARHMVNVETEQGLDHWPNIYCGVAVIMLFAAYLLTDRIKLKEKAVYCAMLLIFLASFSVNVLNFIWHGFHYPNSLPCRQSFIYIFLMLCICARVYMNIDKIPLKLFGAAYLFSAGFILFCEKVITAKHYHFSVFYVSLIFISAYALLIYLWKKRYISAAAAVISLFSVVTLEAGINTAVTSVTTTSRELYLKDNKAVSELVSTLTPATDFFRVEKIPSKTKNDGAWLNFPSVSLFSSMANAEVTDFFKATGCEGSTNAYALTGSTPLINMLFSVKYAIYDSAQEDGEEKKFIESIDSSYLYENNYSLSVGFMMPQGMSGWALDFDDPALVQDDLCRILGTDAVLVPNATLGDENRSTYTVTIGEDGEYYTYIKNPGVKKVSVEKGDERRTFENVDRGYFIELGSCKAGEVVTIKSETDGQDIMAETYRFDYGALRQAYALLSENELVLSSWTDSGLKGTIDAGVGGVMFTSIPYDEGWSIKVDGKEVRPKKIFESFMGISLTEGKHYIEMSFAPKGLKTGAVISIASALLMLFAAAAGRRRKARIAEDRIGNKGESRRQDEEAFGKRKDDFYDGPYDDTDDELCEEDEEEDGFLDDPDNDYGLSDLEEMHEEEKNAFPSNCEKNEKGKNILDELSRELSFDFSSAKNDLLAKLDSMEDMTPAEKSDTGGESPKPESVIERFNLEKRRRFYADETQSTDKKEEKDYLTELTERLSSKKGAGNIGKD